MNFQHFPYNIIKSFFSRQSFSRKQWKLISTTPTKKFQPHERIFREFLLGWGIPSWGKRSYDHFIRHPSKEAAEGASTYQQCIDDLLLFKLWKLWRGSHGWIIMKAVHNELTKPFNNKCELFSFDSGIIKIPSHKTERENEKGKLMSHGRSDRSVDGKKKRDLSIMRMTPSMGGWVGEGRMVADWRKYRRVTKSPNHQKIIQWYKLIPNFHNWLLTWQGKLWPGMVINKWNFFEVDCNVISDASWTPLLGILSSIFFVGRRSSREQEILSWL